MTLGDNPVPTFADYPQENLAGISEVPSQREHRLQGLLRRVLERSRAGDHGRHPRRHRRLDRPVSHQPGATAHGHPGPSGQRRCRPSRYQSPALTRRPVARRHPSSECGRGPASPRNAEADRRNGTEGGDDGLQTGRLRSGSLTGAQWGPAIRRRSSRSLTRTKSTHDRFEEGYCFTAEKIEMSTHGTTHVDSIRHIDPTRAHPT